MAQGEFLREEAVAMAREAVEHDGSPEADKAAPIWDLAIAATELMIVMEQMRADIAASKASRLRSKRV